LIDFLFKSEYQEQLSTILGMLPSTSLFFSAGDHLFVRLSVPSEREKDLAPLISELKEKGYFSEYHQSTAVLTSGGFNGHKPKQEKKKLFQDI
jgi:hypothetical protein